MQVLLETVRRNPHPLYVSILIHLAATWQSHTHVEAGSLPVDMEDAFRQVLRGLDEDLGSEFVETALLYMSLLPYGVSEVELCDVMTISGKVLQVIIVIIIIIITCRTLPLIVITSHNSTSETPYGKSDM